MGLTQQRHGVAAIQMVVNLLLLRGNLGKPGAGACPVRGHSNVQGDRTMGIFEKPPAWVPKLGEVFGFDGFRAGQREVIEHILAGRPVPDERLFPLGQCPRKTTSAADDLRRIHRSADRRRTIPAYDRRSTDGPGCRR